MAMEQMRVHLVIEGRVQGVWFRDSTRRKALSLGVHGWVRNLPDGRVEVVAEGSESQVNELVAWCHQGPPYAQVTRVHENVETWQGEFTSFGIHF